MSIFNRKGFRPVKATHPKTGQPYNAMIKIGSSIDRKRDKLIKNLKASQQKGNREYKKALRELKMSYPIEERSKINWSEKLREINNAK